MVPNDAQGPVMSARIESPSAEGADKTKIKRWSVFQCQNRREFLAKQQLKNQGFEVLIPTIKAAGKTNRRSEVSTKPLFPGYGFVAIDINSRWQAVNGTIGVTRLLSSPTDPLYLPSEFVEHLLAITDPGGQIDFTNLYRKGDRVHILTGPFMGTIAEIETTDPRGRITILLSLLNSKVRVRTNSNNIGPVFM